MQYDEFIERVQARAQLDSRQDVETLTAITLATLAEPLSREATNLLASQLPKALKDVLLTHRAVPDVHAQTMQTYSLEEFYNRIKSRLSVTFHQGAALAQAVTLVLPDAITSEVMERVKQDLPAEYQVLFSADS